MARILVLGGVSESLINFRRNLLERMVADGHQVIACAPNPTQEVIDKLLEMGVTYQVINLERAGLNPVRDFKSLLELIKLFKKYRPDYFLGYTIKPVIYGSIAAKLTRVPRIFSMIEGLGYAFTGTGIRRQIFGHIAKVLYRHALKHNTKVFFLNPDDRELFKQLKLVRDAEQQVLLNGIGIDLDEFTPAPLPQAISFLLIARLVRDKGVFEYVEAAKIVKKSFPDVNFRLVGFFDKNPSSVTEQDLNDWVESGAIEYLGYLRDVHQAIADCSVYVLPSYREGLPRTVLEAMAMARAVVTTDAPGCRETVDPGVNGQLVPVGDANKLAEAIEYFINNPDDIIRMGQASRRIAEEKYNVHEVNAVILKTMGLI